MLDQDSRIHPAPFSDWQASQDTSGRGVWIYDRATDEKVNIESPAKWGPNWSWNIDEDGKGVYFRRTEQAGKPTEDRTHEN
jgi:hypothetical protein